MQHISSNLLRVMLSVMVHADCIWFRLCNVVKCPWFLIWVQSKTVTVVSVNLIWMLIISEGYCLRGKILQADFNFWFLQRTLSFYFLFIFTLLLQAAEYIYIGQSC